ncbi:helix-hairpin-helix domain-containing protein [Aurantiacibacter xanthus]|uniref:helix-hairpin-helix domain-containing protein n=1 Tax=Aurantiacibacter xanthus TaxID=1784712 RepID=UPI001C71A1CB|nr:helix-hairpin-helix domain-containing protein [Aurantiacibacter xanthus]
MAGLIMGEHKLTDIAGIGPATEKKLQAAGINGVPALAAADAKELAKVESLANFADELVAWIDAAKVLTSATPTSTPASTVEPQAAPTPAPSPAPPSPPPPPPPPSTQDEAKSIVVTGPKRGRRRAGRLFGAEPVRIPLDELHEAEFDAIYTDPRLSVVIEGEDHG